MHSANRDTKCFLRQHILEKALPSSQREKGCTHQAGCFLNQLDFAVRATMWAIHRISLAIKDTLDTLLQPVRHNSRGGQVSVVS